MSVSVCRVSHQTCEKLGIETNNCLSVFKVENTELEDFKYFKVFEDDEFVYALEINESKPVHDTLSQLTRNEHLQSIRKYFASESGRLYVRLDVCSADFRSSCSIAKLDSKYLKEGEAMYEGRYKYSEQTDIDMQFVTRTRDDGKHDFYWNLPDGDGLKFIKTISGTSESIKVAIHEQLNWYVKFAISTL